MAFSRRKETAWLVVGDVLCLVLSLWLALTLRNLSAPPLGFFLEHLLAFIPIFFISLIIFFIAGLYEKQTRLIRGVMGGRILGAQLASVLFAAVFFFFLPFSIAPKTILALYLGISVLFVSAWRFAAIPRFRVTSPEAVAIAGHGNAVNELIEEVNHNHRYYLHIALHIDTNDASARLPPKIKEAMARGIKTFIIDTRDARVREELPNLYDPMLAGISFIEFSTFYEDVFDRVPLAHIDHAWLLECLPKRYVVYDAAKRAFDLVAGLFCTVIAVPFVLTAVCMLLLSGGTPFIFHERIGREGRVFRIIKLRTMLFDDHGNPELQKENRVTWFGAFLRRTRIDEFPQLFNILLGDLSFIGPRPELPQIAKTYEREIPYYGVRHLIAPGLSGWAQIWDYDAPRGPADIERTKRKLSYDLYYLKRRSFVLDLIICLKTLRALASFSGR